VTTDLDALLTALYVKIGDELTGPRWTGRPPVLTDSELVCLAVAQSLLGFTSARSQPNRSASVMCTNRKPLRS